MALAVGTNAYKVAQAMTPSPKASGQAKNAKADTGSCIATTVKHAAQIAGAASAVAGAAKLAGALLNTTA